MALAPARALAAAGLREPPRLSVDHGLFAVDIELLPAGLSLLVKAAGRVVVPAGRLHCLAVDGNYSTPSLASAASGASFATFASLASLASFTSFAPSSTGLLKRVEDLKISTAQDSGAIEPKQRAQTIAWPSSREPPTSPPCLLFPIVRAATGRIHRGLPSCGECSRLVTFSLVTFQACGVSIARRHIAGLAIKPLPSAQHHRSVGSVHQFMVFIQLLLMVE